MANNLKPCPFCGGEAYVIDTGYQYCIECFNCLASTRYYGVKHEAVKAWNTRAERTCEMEWDEDDEGDELYQVGHVTCSACGAWLYSVNTMRFCPNCGAKVVRE